MTIDVALLHSQRLSDERGGGLQTSARCQGAGCQGAKVRGGGRSSMGPRLPRWGRGFLLLREDGDKRSRGASEETAATLAPGTLAPWHLARAPCSGTLLGHLS